MIDAFKVAGSIFLIIFGIAGGTLLFMFCFRGVILIDNHLSHFVQEQWIEDKEGGCK